MRQRYMIGAGGELVSRDGAVLGKIHSITLDLCVGERGVKEADLSTTAEISSNLDENPTLDGGVGETADDPVRIVWAHYQHVIPNGERYVLDAKKRGIIRKALAVRPLEVVLWAIDGLAASPHHNGYNDRHKKYLGIRYALQGIGSESNEERIDKMAELAPTRTDNHGSRANSRSGVMTVRDFAASFPSGTGEIIHEHVRNVINMRQYPGHRQWQLLGEGSAETLLRRGVEVISEGEAPGTVRLVGLRSVGG